MSNLELDVYYSKNAVLTQIMLGAGETRNYPFRNGNFSNVISCLLLNVDADDRV